MGTKFDHFSILNSDIDSTVELLKILPKKPNALEIMKRLAPDNELFNKPFDEIKKTENQSDEEWHKMQKDFLKLEKMLNSQKRTYYVGKNNDWITVSSEEFSFMGNSDLVLGASKTINNPILTLGLFDEDVFTLSLVMKGMVVTRHVSGSVTAYGMNKSLGDINSFVEIFHIIPQKDKLEQILKNNDDDLYKKIEELENLLSIKLWINRSAPGELKWKKVVC